MPIDSNAFLYGTVADALPTALSDGGQVLSRFDRYGALHTVAGLPGAHNLARSGAYHEFHNATLDASTTLAGHAAPVLADIDATFVKALLFIRNIDAASIKKRLHLLWLETYCTTAGLNGTNSLFCDQIDTGTSRYSSGGTALTVVNPNMESSETLTASMYIMGGAVVVSAETASCRVLGHGKLRPEIEAAGDTVTFVYGDTVAPSHQVAGPVGRHIVVRRPPVILGGQSSYLLGIAAAAQSAASVYDVRGAVAYY